MSKEEQQAEAWPKGATVIYSPVFGQAEKPSEGLTPERTLEDSFHGIFAVHGDGWHLDPILSQKWEECIAAAKAYGDQREVVALREAFADAAAEAKAVNAKCDPRRTTYTEAEVREIWEASRENKDGIYNVPFNAWKYPTFDDYQNREKNGE